MKQLDLFVSAATNDNRPKRTSIESVMADLLTSRGIKFREQVPFWVPADNATMLVPDWPGSILLTVADFMILPSSLGILVYTDGRVHLSADRRRRDNNIDATLMSFGYAPIRVTSDLLRTRPAWAIHRVERAIMRISRRKAAEQAKLRNEVA